MSNNFEQYVSAQKQRLQVYLQTPIDNISAVILEHWQAKNLNQIIQKNLRSEVLLETCQCLYIVDTQGLQISANISSHDLDDSVIGQNLSKRPYLQKLMNPDIFSLSSVYINRLDGESCISSIKILVNPQGLKLGYMIADFSLLSLPANTAELAVRQISLQAKGDPSIRGTLFQQTRTQSLLDDNLDDVIHIVIELLLKRGVFHAKLHFSSSRINLWLYQDPYRYRIHLIDEIKQACLAYPPMDYPTEAIVSETQIRTVFAYFKTLRFIDDTLYLRSASLNIINGMIALNLSCDGTHYLPVQQFLDHPEVYMGFS